MLYLVFHVGKRSMMLRVDNDVFTDLAENGEV